jgi:hypothetical protein
MNVRGFRKKVGSVFPVAFLLMSFSGDIDRTNVNNDELQRIPHASDIPCQLLCGT